MEQQQQQQQQQQPSRHGIENQLQKLEKSVQVDKNYYEAHQMYRTVVNRYIKQKKYNDALLLLHSGAATLLQHEQVGSGTDLALYFVDTLGVSHTAVTADVRERIVTLLKLYPAKDAGRKRIISSAISWSGKYGEYRTGDPHLHHFVGSLYWKEKQYEEAEHHFVLGTEASSRLLGRMAYEWANEQAEPHLMGHFITRAVLLILACKKLAHANTAFQSFCDELVSARSSLIIGNERFCPEKKGEIGRNEGETVPVYSIPLLNFCKLLLFTVQRDAADMFVTLKQRYESAFGEETSFGELLDKVGQTFFNIQPERRNNMLANLMSSLFAPPPSGPQSNSSGGARIGSSTMELD